MDPLTWTGSLAFINPIFLIALVLLAASILLWMGVSILTAGTRHVANADGTMTLAGNPQAMASLGVRTTFFAVAVLALAYVLLGLTLGSGAGIIGAMSRQLLPTWAALVILFGLSISFKRRLGLYGKLFDSPIGMIGFALVMFWVFTGVFAAMDLIATHDPLAQLSGMKNKVPGTPVRGAEAGDYAWYLLGGDNLARDVFSRMVKGAWEVLKYAPLATLFAFMVGITLGLPAGYYGGRLDTVLSFLANLILAFPVILMFYLLVTPEIVATGLPQYMAVVLFAFPLIFCGVLIHSRFRTQPSKNKLWLAVVLVPMALLYLSLVNAPGSKIDFWPLDFFDVPGGVLVVFVSVVFVNSPTVFRIVRGLTMDIKSRDYVAAAQTRGERPWYIMLWEILPNVRGPLIVDFCLRIGYTTILLGTLGFFGLGLPPESPDWGSTINDGRKLLQIYLHPALPPAVALMSLVLGLNLLADGLREESLKD
ncbi:ABC transporter permease [Phaeobacter sp. HF9A]|uniref:ABC transporter permease n=1 Tax=Phaeobacter sp. HF9A TaxID=2721561 RepID=UPI00142F8FE5|nr:ABC transporter permease [Phaeobacter sp. HF9A]NIZ14549.1 ABC transporter permease [Phaeobacter sp. HF9A]